MKHSTEFSNSRHSRNTGNHLYQAQPVTLFFSSPFFLGVGGGGGRIVCVCVFVCTRARVCFFVVFLFLFLFFCFIYFTQIALIGLYSTCVYNTVFKLSCIM